MEAQAFPAGHRVQEVALPDEKVPCNSTHTQYNIVSKILKPMHTVAQACTQNDAKCTQYHYRIALFFNYPLARMCSKGYSSCLVCPSLVRCLHGGPVIIRSA